MREAGVVNAAGNPLGGDASATFSIA